MAQRMQRYTKREIEREEEIAFCKINNVRSYEITRCKFCHQIITWADAFKGTHRTEVHDKPNGITHHTEYYCGMVHEQSQIVLIEPYGLGAEYNNRVGPGNKQTINKPHIYIHANDQDTGKPSRSISLYLTEESAIELHRQLSEALTTLVVRRREQSNAIVN